MKVRDQKTKAMLKALKENPNVALSPAEQIIEFERKLDGIKRRILAGEPVTDEEAQFLADVEQAEEELLKEI